MRYIAKTLDHEITAYGCGATTPFFRPMSARPSLRGAHEAAKQPGDESSGLTTPSISEVGSTTLTISSSSGEGGSGNSGLGGGDDNTGGGDGNDDNKSSLNVGAIAGGVVGGLAVIFLGILGIMYMRMVQKRNQSQAQDQSQVSPSMAEAPAGLTRPPPPPPSQTTDSVQAMLQTTPVEECLEDSRYLRLTPSPPRYHQQIPVLHELPPGGGFQR